MERIKVNTSAMATDVDALNEHIAGMIQAGSKMFEAIGELDQMWDGMANDEFNRQFRQDYDYYKRFCEDLGSYTRQMGQAKSAYEVCENKVIETVRTISIS